ncbi:hypothetical protein [Mucilaginibacter sp. FT3.2]|uniref:hypothetical protein n=1 Tax=Mucilaginibacter sp. FT3.2 TaxID=2723090 RepID=UPI001616F162|nr:hypothetical protein [Mucilaginibacter sp. FT3.2]MBB6230936.1 hypothetical protein [Mucilaginibacter sp. FT3.2]
MLELFIEMTNQVFWEGYAQQLSTENPELYKFRFKQFNDSYGGQQQTAVSNSPTYFNKIIQNNYKRSLKKQLLVK